MAALGSEDWCDPVHGGVFSDGRPRQCARSCPFALPRATAPASSRVSREWPHASNPRPIAGGLERWRGLAARSPRPPPLLSSRLLSFARASLETEEIGRCPWRSFRNRSCYILTADDGIITGVSSSSEASSHPASFRSAPRSFGVAHPPHAVNRRPIHPIAAFAPSNSFQ